MERLEGTGLPHCLGDFSNNFRAGEVVGESLHATGGEGDADDDFDD
jgi:hypothetical protein